MRTRSKVCLAAAAFLAGVTSYLALGGDLRSAWSKLFAHQPAIIYPSEVDLGECERGRESVGHFRISNQGGRDLIVDQIATNCSCGGLERLIDGRYHRVESLRVKPGEAAEVAIRVAVGAPVGTAMSTKVFFRSNDPNHTAGLIEARVRRITGGVSSEPNAVVVGSIPAGTKSRQVVRVFDTAKPPRTIARVASTNPESVRVTMLQGDEQQSKAVIREDVVMIGSFEVLVEGLVPGPLDAQVHVFLDGERRSPDVIPVAGKVVCAFELRPSVVVLPRISQAGPVNETICMCTSLSARPVKVEVESAPVDVTAEIIEAQVGLEGTLVRVRYSPTDNAPQNQPVRILRLRANDGQSTTILELPVFIQR